MEEKLFDLGIFAGEGGEGGATTGQQAGAQAAGTDAAEDAGADAAQDAARREAFENVFSEYKDLFEERFKQNLNRRMKSHDRDMQALKEQNARYEELTRSMSARYGVAQDDLDGIRQAFDQDNAYLEEKAARNGLTVDQQRHMDTIEAENNRLKAAQERIQAQQKADAAIMGWRQEEAIIKQEFPDFDLEAEVANNPLFRYLLTAPKTDGLKISMKDAYLMAHHDELMEQGMQYAVQRGAAATAASVRANGLRPAEGAGVANAPVTIKKDVTKMTSQERKELIRRSVEDGDRIVLG